MSPAEFHQSTLREVSIRLGAAQWRQEQRARMTVMGASLSAKLVRAKATDFRRAVSSIERALRRPIGPVEPQDPETQRLLILDWAQGLGLKVEHHENPVI